MSNSKEWILSQIREKQKSISIPLPEYEGFGICYEDKEKAFENALIQAGANIAYTNKKRVHEVIKKHYKDAKIIVSNISDIISPAKEITKTPHDLSDADLAIVKGKFGVAENGAIWIEHDKKEQRAHYFIAQHLVIILDKNSIYHNMHQAYANITLEKGGFGTFIAGPSKTADIEQALVIGAHGPKSLLVVVL